VVDDPITTNGRRMAARDECVRADRDERSKVEFHNIRTPQGFEDPPDAFHRFLVETCRR